MPTRFVVHPRYSDHSRWSWQSGIQANSSCCIKISTSQFHAQNVVAFSARHEKFKLFLVMLKHLHKVLAFNNYVFCLFTNFTVNFRSKTMSVPCIVLRLILWIFKIVLVGIWRWVTATQALFCCSFIETGLSHSWIAILSVLLCYCACYLNIINSKNC